MIALKLDMPLLSSDFKINFKEKIFFIGSCFAENIGNYLSDTLFDVQINPFGILYHPLAIFNCTDRLINKTIFTENDLVFNQNLWHSWEHHGRFSHYDKDFCLEQINQQIQKGHEQLKQTKYLFLTFGTSIVYELIENGKIVSNCHKIPNTKFKKYSLGIEAIQNTFTDFYQKLKIFNPNIKIICTISPVRHWRDGLVENNKSKSKLIYNVHKWIENYNDVFYFPAYELILDDLRDYRFFERDLCHPNQLGIDYVIEYFKKMYFDEISNEFIRKTEDFLKIKQHRLQFENEAHQNKIQKMKTAIEQEFQIIL